MVIVHVLLFRPPGLGVPSADGAEAACRLILGPKVLNKIAATEEERLSGTHNRSERTNLKSWPRTKRRQTYRAALYPNSSEGCGSIQAAFPSARALKNGFSYRSWTFERSADRLGFAARKRVSLFDPQLGAQCRLQYGQGLTPSCACVLRAGHLSLPVNIAAKVKQHACKTVSEIWPPLIDYWVRDDIGFVQGCYNVVVPRHGHQE